MRMIWVLGVATKEIKEEEIHSLKKEIMLNSRKEDYNKFNRKN